MEDKKQKKEKLQAIKNFGSMSILKMYNDLCKPCKMKSIVATKRKGKALETVFNKYCADCKKRLEEKWNNQ